jgi:SAM-dependent methyltransferase
MIFRQRLEHGAASEADIAGFWETHPCGDELLGGLGERYGGDYEAFFSAYDASRYRLESHIGRRIDSLQVSGLRVLEIGLGQGSESEQLIRRGARWTGLDITPESVQRVKTRLGLRELTYEGIHVGSATQIPEPDEAFDLVFSHGVLHHVPAILDAQAEIHRVLRPGGRLAVMLYARQSLNYQVSIRIGRRLGLLTVWPLRRSFREGRLGAHLRNAEREGLFHYLRMDRFIHASTDGPYNPFSRVYTLDEVRRDFPSFEIIRAHKEFMHAPPLPVHGLPGGGFMGWHLWVEMRRR